MEPANDSLSQHKPIMPWGSKPGKSSTKMKRLGGDRSPCTIFLYRLQDGVPKIALVMKPVSLT